jgi:hypothetical protein
MAGDLVVKLTRLAVAKILTCISRAACKAKYMKFGFKEFCLALAYFSGFCGRSLTFIITPWLYADMLAFFTKC